MPVVRVMDVLVLDQRRLHALDQPIGQNPLQSFGNLVWRTQRQPIINTLELLQALIALFLLFEGSNRLAEFSKLFGEWIFLSKKRESMPLHRQLSAKLWSHEVHIPSFTATVLLDIGQLRVAGFVAIPVQFHFIRKAARNLRVAADQPALRFSLLDLVVEGIANDVAQAPASITVHGIVRAAEVLAICYSKRGLRYDNDPERAGSSFVGTL
mmetsp:Transcript_56261/g.131908  ORF Transcript_56261/g.131908 Transcript_56261/m.131908 type:complete len:211 (+) Transcript_56261:3226-3858(+)